MFSRTSFFFYLGFQFDVVPKRRLVAARTQRRITVAQHVFSSNGWHVNANTAVSEENRLHLSIGQQLCRSVSVPVGSSVSFHLHAAARIFTAWCDVRSSLDQQMELGRVLCQSYQLRAA